MIAAADGRAAAFLFQQETPRNFPHCEAEVPIEEVERRSGLRLFPRLAGRSFGGLAAALGCPA